jgi:sugar O-acyltransferase (sialic acid O-acetyltransferase NeuD family)
MTMLQCQGSPGVNEIDKPLSIIGASGHAKVVASVAMQLGYTLFGFYDDNKTLHDLPFFYGYVKGCVESAFDETQYPYALAIGTNSIRKAIYKRYISMDWPTIISPFAYSDTTSNIGLGSVVMTGAIIQPGVSIGEQCIINTKASIDHEVIIGDFAQVAPGAIVCGNVHIGECSYIGAGAVIKQGVHIGENVMIGAGSIIIKDVPSNVMVYGDAARIIKEGVFV